MDEQNVIQNSPTVETKPVLDPVEQQKVEQSKSRASVLSELGQLRAEVKSFKISDLVVPALSLIVLMLLTVFVYLPMLRSAFEAREEKTGINSNISKLERLNSDLDGIAVSQLQQDLAVSRNVIPFSLQVSDFVSYVDTLARAKGLVFREILAGNVQVRSGEDSRTVDPVVRGVSGPLRYTGNLEQVTSFLDELQTTSPFIISASDIELRKAVGGETWDLSLSVIGFYMDQNSLPVPNIYTSFSPYRQFSDILDVFRDKVEQLPQERFQEVDLDIEQ